MELGKEMGEIMGEIREVRRHVNDISHTVARLEEDIKWIKTVLKWAVVVMGFLLGLNIGL